MPETLNELRRRGLQALRRELGRAGLVRFLQQFETGKGDYAHERREWVDSLSLEELRALSHRGRASRAKRRNEKR